VSANQGERQGRGEGNDKRVMMKGKERVKVKLKGEHLANAINLPRPSCVTSYLRMSRSRTDDDRDSPIHVT
jgi:hypothetical protein